MEYRQARAARLPRRFMVEEGAKEDNDKIHRWRACGLPNNSDAMASLALPHFTVVLDVIDKHFKKFRYPKSKSSVSDFMDLGHSQHP